MTQSAPNIQGITADTFLNIRLRSPNIFVNQLHWCRKWYHNSWHTLFNSKCISNS